MTMPTSTSGDVKPRFKVNQKVVYPIQGVGNIQSIFERDFQGRRVLYYTIYLQVNDMTVMVPVEKADELGLRAISEQSKVKEALNIIGHASDPGSSDWKLRYQTNMSLLKEGGLNQIATVVRNLYHRSKTKELPIMERKLYDNALRLLIDEITYSMNLPSHEAEQMILTRLESRED